jgi:hypothetical protein
MGRQQLALEIQPNRWDLPLFFLLPTFEDFRAQKDTLSSVFAWVPLGFNGQNTTVGINGEPTSRTCRWSPMNISPAWESVRFSDALFRTPAKIPPPLWIFLQQIPQRTQQQAGSHHQYDGERQFRDD